VANPNYVKKVVFPLEVLPVVLLCTTVFHAFMASVVLLGAMLAVFGAVPASALLAPLVLLPLCLMCLGFAWVLAALGVFLRDIGHLVSIAVGICMFLSPLFYPLSALPERVRFLVYLNPVTVPVEQLREVVIWGRMPDWTLLGTYALAAVLVLMLGYAWFRLNKRAFADVL
jgi:lipopolysaccharide transport system permease protein